MRFSLKPETIAKGMSEHQRVNALPATGHVITDEDLWRSFQRGEDAAFTMLYGRYSDRIYAYLKLLLASNPHQLDDMFQDVWILLFRERSRITAEHNGAFGGWLFRAAHNMAISFLRKKEYSLSLEELNTDTELIEGFVMPATQDKFGNPSTEDMMVRVAREVERLPVLLREVFVLSEFNGLTLDQIASTLGITRTNAKVRLFRARRTIRERLTKGWDASQIGDAI